MVDNIGSIGVAGLDCGMTFSAGYRARMYDQIEGCPDAYCSRVAYSGYHTRILSKAKQAIPSL